jgi:hypothetical protein
MSRWYVRQSTKHGGFHSPLTALNRSYEASSAIRRQEQRIHDRQILANYVQLAPGVLVVYDRQPWRVVEVTERPLDLWGDDYEKRFAAAVEMWERSGGETRPGGGKCPEKATWTSRPVVVILAPDGKPHEEPVHLIGPYHHRWDVLPEHYAICSACGELPPCRDELNEREADQQAAKADVVMDIPPGHCLGCGEFVTTRQNAARFPGPNLWRPDLPENSAVFHARQECSGEVDRYRRAWEARGNNDPQTALFADEENAS